MVARYVSGYRKSDHIDYIYYNYSKQAASVNKSNVVINLMRLFFIFSLIGWNVFLNVMSWPTRAFRYECWRQHHRRRRSQPKLHCYKNSKPYFIFEIDFKSFFDANTHQMVPFFLSCCCRTVIAHPNEMSDTWHLVMIHSFSYFSFHFAYAF